MASTTPTADALSHDPSTIHHGAPGAESAEAGRSAIRVDDRNASRAYANFCRVSSTPEELIIDFGLNTAAAGAPGTVIPVDQRIVLNHYTAKRLLGALQYSIRRHESVFGPLETDVQKRVVATPQS